MDSSPISKKVTFSNQLEVEIGQLSTSYRDNTSNPLYEMLKIYNVDEMEEFLRVSLTYILGKNPGVTKYNHEKSEKWTRVLEEYNDLDEDFHELIIEICPWFVPVDRRWGYSDLEILTGSYD